MQTWMCNNEAWAKVATLAPDVSLGLSCPTHWRKDPLQDIAVLHQT